MTMFKRIFILITLLSGVIAFGQRKPKIKGNKSVIEINETLPYFNAIELNDDLEVNLEKSTSEGYRLELDDNLVDVLRFKVKDSALVIRSFYKIVSKKKLNITVYYTELSKIKMLSGKMYMKDVLTTDELDILTKGTSRLEVNATADIINLNMNEISSGDFNFVSDSLNITLKDRIDVRLYSVGARNTVSMYNNASGFFEGTADVFDVNLYDNTNLKAERLEADKANVYVQLSTKARVNVLSHLRLESRGSAKTYLYGNPKIEIVEFLDTSQLHKERK